MTSGGAAERAFALRAGDAAIRPLGDRLGLAPGALFALFGRRVAKRRRRSQRAFGVEPGQPFLGRRIFTTCGRLQARRQSLPRRRRLEAHVQRRPGTCSSDLTSRNPLVSIDFGRPATGLSSKSEDPWLCVPASRRVCPNGPASSDTAAGLSIGGQLGDRYESPVPTRRVLSFPGGPVIGVESSERGRKSVQTTAIAMPTMIRRSPTL